MKNKRKGIKKKSGNKKIIVQSTTILILIAAACVAGGYFYLKIKYGYKGEELVQDILGNLVGVLAAFVLFDIIYNAMTQEAFSKETSNHITKTLMGDPETLDAFTDEDKKSFIKSTLNSIVKDESVVEMLMNNVNNYIEGLNALRIRTSFDYKINVVSELSKACGKLPGSKEYYYVEEVLGFDIKCLDLEHSKFVSKKVKIGFLFDKLNLDKGLLESGEMDFNSCIFCESLDITREDIAYLRKIEEDPEKLNELFQDIFTTTLKIDSIYGNLDKVEIRNTGILVTYNVDYDVTKLDHNVRIIFHMPKKWGSLFEITLVDPTRSPKITFDYDPDTMNVSMYSFLNKGDESNGGAYEERNGIYDISIKDEWIYPKSGIVFTVSKKE